MNAVRWVTRVFGVTCLSASTSLFNVFAVTGLTALLAYLLVKLHEEVKHG